MNNTRHITASALIICALLFAFAVPRPKYHSQDVLSKLDIPFSFGYWKGGDASDILNFRDQRYNFVGQVFARYYRNDLGESLLCLILDVNNFHPPANCYKSAGYTILNQERFDYNIPDSARQLSAESFYAQKGSSGVLVVYWTCLNMSISNNWLLSEFQQLWSNLVGKERVGIMLRIDIPTSRDHLDGAKQSVRDYLKKMYLNTSPDVRDFVFGSNEFGMDNGARTSLSQTP